MALKFAVNNSLSAVTSLPTAVPTGSMTLLQTQTTSSSVGSVDFTTGIDSTYKAYLFKLINVRPATDDRIISFQGSTNGGSSFGVTTTNARFITNHKEDDSSSTLTYTSGQDLAQSTSFINIGHGVGGGADEGCAVEIILYNPSSTTFVKHYMFRGIAYHATNRADNYYGGGYFNTTSAINAIRFQGNSIAEGGGITTPTINIATNSIFKLYGIS
jgi:hypothetical protein